MQLFRAACFVYILLMLSGCATFAHLTGKKMFSNTGNETINENEVAIIQDHYFHYPWSFWSISKLEKTTGKYEEIHNSRTDGVRYKFVLIPGSYEITYGSKHYKMPLIQRTGRVELKAGHKYRVNHAICDAVQVVLSKRCEGKVPNSATVWFEDLTTGDVLHGDKW